METKFLSIILYPLLMETLDNKNKEKIYNTFSGINEEILNEAIKKQATIDEIKEIAKEIPDEEKQEYFNLAKSLLDNNITRHQLIALAEIGKILNIDKSNTGFEFNIYDIEEIDNFEYYKTIKNFSLVAGAIGFIPFIPISDFAILTPLQISMVTKIFNLYNFNIDVKEFFKLIGGTVGFGIIFRTTSRILTNLIPIFGWIINAGIAYAGTYTIGILAKRYVEENGILTQETIKSIAEKSFEDGKKEFEKLKKFLLQKKDLLFKELSKFLKNENIKNDQQINLDKKDKSENITNKKKKNNFSEEENIFQ